MKIFTLLFTLMVLMVACTSKQANMQSFPATHPALHWQGRITEDKQGHKWMFGSAANLRFQFKGDS